MLALAPPPLREREELRPLLLRPPPPPPLSDWEEDEVADPDPVELEGFVVPLLPLFLAFFNIMEIIF